MVLVYEHRRSGVAVFHLNNQIAARKLNSTPTYPGLPLNRSLPLTWLCQKIWDGMLSQLNLPLFSTLSYQNVKSYRSSKIADLMHSRIGRFVFVFAFVLGGVYTTVWSWFQSFSKTNMTKSALCLKYWRYKRSWIFGWIWEDKNMRSEVIGLSKHFLPSSRYCNAGRKFYVHWAFHTYASSYMWEIGQPSQVKL